MPQVAHQGTIFLCAAGLADEFLKPFSKRSVECFALRPRHQACLLDQVVIRAESNVFHTEKVYTIFVLHRNTRGNRAATRNVSSFV